MDLSLLLQDEGLVFHICSAKAANSTSSGICFSLMALNMLVEVPLFLSSRSILFIQIVMFIIAFFKVTILSRSSSSVHEDIFRGIQHLREITRSFSSPPFNGYYTPYNIRYLWKTNILRLISLAFQNVISCNSSIDKTTCFEANYAYLSYILQFTL